MWHAEEEPPAEEPAAEAEEPAAEEPQGEAPASEVPYVRELIAESRALLAEGLVMP